MCGQTADNGPRSKLSNLENDLQALSLVTRTKDQLFVQLPIQDSHTQHHQECRINIYIMNQPLELTRR